MIVVLTGFMSVWLAVLLLTILAPRRWSLLIDREHDLLLRFRLCSQGYSRRVKPLEKGPVLQVILAGTIFLGLLALAFLVLRALGVLA